MSEKQYEKYQKYLQFFDDSLLSNETQSSFRGTFGVGLIKSRCYCAIDAEVVYICISQTDGIPMTLRRVTA